MSTEIDTSGFTSMLRDLEKLSCRPFESVLLDQVGTLLDLCIKYSPSPFNKYSDTDLKKVVRLRVEKPSRYITASGTAVVNRRVPRPVEGGTLQTGTGRRGGTAGQEWYITTKHSKAGKRIILHGDRLRGPAYYSRAARSFLLAEELGPKAEAAIAAIGSEKASWVDVADRIGAPLRKSPQWVRRVRLQRPDGALSKLSIHTVEAFVDIVNTNSALIQHNGQRILQNALSTRELAFMHELRAGVFEDLANRARRYPGIFTS